jgi:hypothetical protein
MASMVNAKVLELDVEILNYRGGNALAFANQTE